MQQLGSSGAADSMLGWLAGQGQQQQQQQQQHRTSTSAVAWPAAAHGVAGSGTPRHIDGLAAQPTILPQSQFFLSDEWFGGVLS